MELVRRVDARGPARGVAPNGGDRDERDVFHVTFDPNAEPIGVVVAESVATIRNSEIEELEPVYEAVDPEALDGLVSPDDDAQSGVDEVQFVYEGLEVTVEADGDLWLRWR